MTPTTSPRKTLKQLIVTWDDQTIIDYRQSLVEIIEIAAEECCESAYEQAQLATVKAEMRKRGLA